MQRQATAKGALKAVQVAVSGAFHTPLMQPAREALTQVGTAVAITALSDCRVGDGVDEGPSLGRGLGCTPLAVRAPPAYGEAGRHHHHLPTIQLR